MANTDTLQILTQITSDKRALTQTLADFRLARTGLREMANEAKSVDVSLARMGSGAMTLGMRLRGTTAPAVEATAREFAELRTQALAATAAMQQAGAASGAAGGAAGGRSALSRLRGLSVETLGREIVGLPSVQLGPISSNDLGQGLRLAGQQGATFSGIAAAMAPVVAIAAPLAAGFLALEHSLQGAKRALAAAVLANHEYYELIGRGATTADLETQIEEAQRARDAAQRELDVLTHGTEQGFDRLVESAGTGIAVIDDIGARFTMGLVSLTSADDAHAAALAEAETAIFNANAQIARFTAGLDAGETAVADLAAATDLWVEGLQTHSDFLEGLSAANLAAIASEAAASLQLEKEKSTATTAALAEAESNLNAKRELGVAITKAATEAAEAAAADLAALAKEKTARGIAAEQALLDGMVRIDADLAAAQTKAAAEQSKALTDAATEARKDMADAAVEANKEAEDAERDHRQTLRRIQRDGNRDIAVAIQDRNAVAEDAARTNLKSAVDDETESYDNRRKDINDQLKKTQADIVARLAQQRQAARDSYQAQLNTAGEAARKALTLEQSKQAQLLGVQTNYQSNAIASAKNFGAQMQYEIAKGLAVSGSGGKGIPAAKIIPKAHTGAYITQGGLLNVRQGEVYTEQQWGKRGMPSITINGIGLSARAVGDMVVEALEEYEKG